MRRLQKKYFIGLFLQILLALILSNAGLAAQTEETDKSIKSPEATTEAVNAVVTGSDAGGYIYDPTNKTDPFKSFLTTKEDKEKGKTKTYLETMELSQLDLVVTVVGPKGRWAMVKDSKGMGHVVNEGTPIGTNNGVVYKISQGEVVIREEYKDFKGQTQFREIIKEAGPQM
jgi:Tfp pilus assembly protein PilP